MYQHFQVVGIGEMLWDVFPEGKRLGGAPTNFCCHCRQLGAEAIPVSAVGRDEFGRELLGILSTMGLPADQVAVDPIHPTGTVVVTLDKGKPTYEITSDVAWDHIPMTPALSGLARRADAVCFGSLAQRGTVSCVTIHDVLSAMNPEALKIFDVNLRQTFYSAELLRRSLEHCNILKVSDEELPVLADLFTLKGNVVEQIRALIETFSLRLVAYTRGGQGSLLLSQNGYHEHPGFRVDAINTVGAGDSFTAALCMGLLGQRSLEEVNEQANRIAAFVCTQFGATPGLPGSYRDAWLRENHVPINHVDAP
jgi:fructokinase